jgi:hypothetical protein
MRLWVILLLVGALAPTTAPVNQSTPKGALKLFSKALDSGDRNAILASLAADSEQDHKVAAATADLAEAVAQLRAATVKAFGPEKSRALGVDPTSQSDAAQRIDTAIETIEGDKATVRAADNEGPPTQLVRRDGRWLMPVAELSKDVESADVDKNLADIAQQIKAMREIAAEVAAGKFKTAVDARQALDERIVGSAMPATQASTRPAK